MNISQSLASPGFMLTDQIKRQIFEVLPERGPLLVIMDTNGDSQSSDPEEFAKLNISESFLKDICVTIDDGAEPVMTSSNDCSIVAEQLATEDSNYGYVFVILPKYKPESTLLHVDLIEMLLNQIGLIARLIEKNNFHYKVQMKQYQICGPSEAALN
ncbi:MAG: hypothetical protein RQ760_17390 [Sedimentisphaerales bacterium]|nr:hypothetical protein [Sedimentisphaerales bacterium]